MELDLHYPAVPMRAGNRGYRRQKNPVLIPVREIKKAAGTVPGETHGKG
jgi:hypothetical protein